MINITTEIVAEIIAKDGAYFAFILGMALFSVTYMAIGEVRKRGFIKTINETYDAISSYVGSLFNKPWRMAV